MQLRQNVWPHPDAGSGAGIPWLFPAGADEEGVGDVHVDGVGGGAALPLIANTGQHATATTTHEAFNPPC